jgi:hypothetical protein
MPEQITKYPDVTLEVLRSAGAHCGEGRVQEILTQCPTDRFCALPGGEMCIYGLEDTPKMTQIQPEELAAIVCPPPDSATASLFPDLGSAAMVFTLGLILGVSMRRRK